jgi:hypothetical protein
MNVQCRTTTPFFALIVPVELFNWGIHMKFHANASLLVFTIGSMFVVLGPMTSLLHAQLEGPSSGLVAWWRFEEPSGPNVLDSSTSGSHTGLLMGAASRTNGMSGSALYLHGFTDFVRIPLANDLLLGTRTITFWAQADAFLHADGRFFGWGRGDAGKRGDNTGVYYFSNGSIYSSYQNATGAIIRYKQIAPSGTIKLGEWAHYTFVYTGSPSTVSIACYKNGQLCQTPYTATDGLSDGMQAMTSIGSQEDLPNPRYVRLFCGKLDDFRVYNRALSATEITNLYSQLRISFPDITAPSVPTGLTATALSHWQIKLTWAASTDNVSVAGYIVYRSGSPIASVYGSTTYEDVEHSPSTMYDRTVAPTTTYSYTVAAFDAAYNVSSQSGTASATTPANPGGPMYTLTIVQYGTVLQTIQSVPDGISTPATNVASFPSGTCVQLTPYPFILGMGTSPPGFVGWGGDLAGNAEGFLRMTTNKVVYAYYNVPIPDTSPPIITAFIIPSTWTNRTVPIISLVASDNAGTTGYRVSETNTTPQPQDLDWTAGAPLFYTFNTDGSKTLYAWAKDASSNISASASAPILITVRPYLCAAQMSNNNFRLSFDAIEGKTYVVEQSTNLTSWFDFQTNGPIPNTGLKTLEIPTNNWWLRFFRLRDAP